MKMKSASMGIVIEIKYSEEPNLEAACRHALKQIEELQYQADLENRGISGDRIRKYGFAFEGKEVLIKS